MALLTFGLACGFLGFLIGFHNPCTACFKPTYK